MVQQGLQRLVDVQSSASYVHRPVLDAELEQEAQRARETMRDHLRDLFAEGYRRGTKLASELSWPQLRRLVVDYRSVKRAGDRMHELFFAPEYEALRLAPGWELPLPVEVLAGYLDLVNTDTAGPQFTVDVAVSDGMDAAVRDFYESVALGDR